MEHSCQKCGATVEDGRPFCPQCRAPQISVKVAVADAISPDLDSAPNSAGVAPSNRPSKVADKLDSGVAARAALKAGVLGVFIGAIPFVGIVLTGALAVFFYRRKSGLVLPPVLGARLGGAAGVVVFAIGAFFTIAVIMSHAQQQCIDLMMATLQRFGANTADPQIQANIHNLFTASGQAISFFVLVVSASVGGGLASLVLRPRGPRE